MSLLLPITILMSSLVAAPEVEVRTLGGQTLTGSLKELSAERVVVQTSGGEQTIAAKDLLGVSLRGQSIKDAGKPQVWIELAGGGKLVGLEYSAREKQATLKLLDGEELSLTTSQIASVRLKEQSEKIAQQWGEIAGGKHASDVIIVRREESIDFLEGVLGDVSSETVQFTIDGDLVNVKRPRVEGFLYFHAPGEQPPAAVCQVQMADGARLPASRLTLDGESLTLVTPSGLELKRPLESIKELDFSLGKLRYLSDLEWESVQRHDYLSVSDARPERFYEPRKDSSFFGPLRLGNKTYAKGLALKSFTKLVYRLPGKFSRLTGLAGINAQVAPAGNVRLVIRGDQQTEPLLETTIAGSDPPHELSVDLAGVKRLTIEVDFGQGGDAGDHLNLCELRIVQ